MCAVAAENHPSAETRSVAAEKRIMMDGVPAKKKKKGSGYWNELRVVK